MTTNRATKLLRNGLPLILTLSSAGPSYSIDGHGTVPTKYARALVAGSDMPGQPQGDLFLVANDDGLFPGCSQTWQAVS